LINYVECNKINEMLRYSCKYSVGNLNSYNADIFVMTDFRRYVYWNILTRIDFKNTSLSYEHPTDGHTVYECNKYQKQSQFVS
jgi:hypothetical protein